MLRLFRGAAGYGDLVNRLRKGIETGSLTPGARLPSQRRLAYDLGIAIGTVTRAFQVAEREGLITSYIGRGSFVAPLGVAADRRRLDRDTDTDIQLSLDEPLEMLDPPIGETLREIANDPSCGTLSQYHSTLWGQRHRDAGVQWIKRFGLTVPADNVVVTAGAQHAILCALATTCRPGDVVMAEELSYPGFRGAVEMLGLRVEPIKVDTHGIVPSAVEDICAKTTPRALYVTPSCQNPTNCQLNASRRAHLARLAEKHDFAIIEDDLRPRSVLPSPPPIASLAPNRTFLIAGVSKTLGGGLRVGFMAVPKRWMKAVSTSVWASMHTTSPLNAEIATRLILSGAANRVALAKEKEAKVRRGDAERILGSWDVRTHAGSTVAWLVLPKPWTSAQAAVAIREGGISIAPSEAFWNAHTPPPNAIRISLGVPRTRESLNRALERIAAILASPPDQIRL